MSSEKLLKRRKTIEAKELARRKSKKTPYSNLLIVSEGKTELNYFNDLRRCFRHMGINIILEKLKGSAPITLVDFAIEYAYKNEAIDYVFCVFDRDEHTSYNEAVEKIRNYQSPKRAKSKPKFKAITSSPCFEIWVLLHFVFSSKSYSKTGNKTASEHVVSELEKHFPEYSKSMTNLFTELRPKLTMAIQNSKKLFEHNEKTASINPSTQMHVLIDFIFGIIGVEV